MDVMLWWYLFDVLWVFLVGFMGVMMLNLVFVFSNMFLKKGMKGKLVSGMNYYVCLLMMFFLIFMLFVIVVEGFKMWVVGWENVVF